jgi:hypothetical protein
LLAIVAPSGQDPAFLAKSIPIHGTWIQPINVSDSNVQPDVLSLFTGAGSKGIFLTAFVGVDNTVGVTPGMGTITYNYTPTAVAVTPEPTGLTLLGTGLLCVVGVMIRRVA